MVSAAGFELEPGCGRERSRKAGERESAGEILTPELAEGEGSLEERSKRRKMVSAAGFELAAFIRRDPERSRRGGACCRNPDPAEREKDLSMEGLQGENGERGWIRT